MAMLDSLKAMLANPGSSRRREAPDLRVATAAVLLEVAEADQYVAPEEFETILELLADHFELSRDDAEALVRETEQARAGASDLWPFTNVIGDAYSPEEKRDVLVMVWRVIFADGRLDPYEDQLAHRLERMLRINHSLLMEAKQLARQAGNSSSG